ncbi:MAG: thioredoxin domain-containing protein [Vulcanimicrobiaceae bacterium]
MSAIEWQSWNDETFARAQRENKPILLSISATWCHWCHVMDKTTYSDDGVIARVNERYVPIRVDNDRRPDINARYNQGGWPTTAFLAPDGSLLTGATYLPPEPMRRALDEISTFYQENRPQIEARAAQIAMREPPYDPGAAGDLQPEVVARLAESIADSYDEVYGGFGTEPKFPMPDVLEFLLQTYRLNGTQRFYDIVAKSMLAMAGGGMYDHVEGGFFRYSTTRDWSIPHFEKMAEDQAALMRVLAPLFVASRNPQFRTTLHSTTAYVMTVLRDPNTSLFAGSQDADEAYYALPLEERRKRNAPYVDRTSYSNWSADLAGALCAVAHALDDDPLQVHALTTLDTLHARLRDDDGLLYHVLDSSGTVQIRGLLVDQSAYLRALLDAHEFSGEPRFLDRAREIAQAVERRHAAPGGGYYDHASLEGELGNLRFKDRPLRENASIADSLLRLSVLDDDDRYRERAERTLLVFAKTFEHAGTFAAAYGRTLERYFTPPASVVIVATPQAGAALREEAHGLPNPLVVVRTISPSETSALERRHYDPAVTPVAYACVGTVCAPPAHDPEALAAAFETLSASRR